ncbi:MAG: hypothetical protein RIG77_10055 [Cyclobacteriaceae bacterium]
MKYSWQLISILALSFLYFIFTPYRYELVNSEGNSYLLKIKRINGETFRFTGETWIPTSDNVGSYIEGYERTLIKGNGRFEREKSTSYSLSDAYKPKYDFSPLSDRFIITLYNGTNRYIKSFTVYFNVYDSDGKIILQKDFRKKLIIHPLSEAVVTIYNVEIGQREFKLDTDSIAYNFARFTWSLDDILGSEEY